MKTIRILILLSLFLGSYSVYSQATNTETKKSEIEKRTERADPELKSAGETNVLSTREKIPSATKESKVSVNTKATKDSRQRTAGDQPDPSKTEKESKTTPATHPKSKIKSQLSAGDTDPKKLK